MKTTRLRWKESVRIVGAEHGPIDALERVTSPDDLDDVLAFEALTTPAAAALRERVARIPSRQRVVGPGSTDAMAPFLHFSASGGRFSDGTYGVYYAARDRDTAIAETCFHRERLLREFAAPSQTVAMRVLLAALDVQVQDLRGSSDTSIIDPDPARYASAQALGARLRAAGVNGVAYDSVRQPGGECAALFSPGAVGKVHRAERLNYEWSASRNRIVTVSHVVQERT